jgi:hypothetical protein
VSSKVAFILNLKCSSGHPVADLPEDAGGSAASEGAQVRQFVSELAAIGLALVEVENRLDQSEGAGAGYGSALQVKHLPFFQPLEISDVPLHNGVPQPKGAILTPQRMCSAVVSVDIKQSNGLIQCQSAHHEPIKPTPLHQLHPLRDTADPSVYIDP